MPSRELSYWETVVLVNPARETPAMREVRLQAEARALHVSTQIDANILSELEEGNRSASGDNIKVEIHYMCPIYTKF